MHTYIHTYIHTYTPPESKPHHLDQSQRLRTRVTLHPLTSRCLTHAPFHVFIPYLLIHSFLTVRSRHDSAGLHYFARTHAHCTLTHHSPLTLTIQARPRINPHLIHYLTLSQPNGTLSRLNPSQPNPQETALLPNGDPLPGTVANHTTAHLLRPQSTKTTLTPHALCTRARN